MIFFMGEVFFEYGRDPVNALADLFIRKTAPDRLHEPIVRKCLEINGQAGFVDLPGEAEGHRTAVGFNELMRISGHQTLLSLSATIPYRDLYRGFLREATYSEIPWMPFLTK